MWTSLEQNLHLLWVCKFSIVFSADSAPAVSRVGAGGGWILGGSSQSEWELNSGTGMFKVGQDVYPKSASCGMCGYGAKPPSVVRDQRSLIPEQGKELRIFSAEFVGIFG